MDYNYYNYNNYFQLLKEHQSFSNNNSAPPTMPNRFVYVNQNFQKPKVLINPNFKKTIHINPNFKGTIHVNPKIIQLKQDCVTRNKSECDTSVKVLSNNVAPNSNSTNQINNTKTILNTRRQSVHTKYKIIHVKNGQSDVTERKHCVKSKYTIDKRLNVSDRRSNVKKLIKTRYKLLNNDVNKTRRNNKFVNISGVLYKKTPNVLKKADLSINKSAIKKKLKVLKVNGRIYKLTRSSNSSTSMDSKSRNSISRSINKKKLLLSQTKNFSKQVFLSKMRKCNIPCPIYRKFGKCHGKNKGTCFRIHNPNQIALCTRFLQGACRKKNCLLSHKVSAEKVPTCKYYLEGLCTREDCPYLHVKINPKADICKDFLEGFCKKAKECDKRHQFLCPDYEKMGSCPRKRCQYPHGDVVRKYCLKAKVAKKALKVLNEKIEKIKAKRKRQKQEKEHNQNNDKKIRYYIDTTGNLTKFEIIINNEKDEVGEIIDDGSPIPARKRKSVGDLPSFISF